MHFQKKIVFIILAIFLVSSVFTGCSGTDKQKEGEKPAEAKKEPVYVNIAAAPAGPGVWYLFGESLMKNLKDANIPNTQVGEVLPGASVSNIIQVNDGKAFFGLTGADTVEEARVGKAPFEKKYENTRQILNLFPQYFQPVVSADAKINSFKDITGKSMNVYTLNSNTELLVRSVLDLYGITYKNLSRTEHLWFDAAYDMMRDGRLDGSFLLGPYPHPYTVDLAMSRNIKVLSMDDEIIEKVVASNSGFEKAIMEPGKYKGVDQEVVTIKSPTILVASSNMSEGVVYELTKNMIENWDKISAVHPLLSNLKPEDLARETSCTYHPGAEKYFKEKGLIK